MTFLSVFMMLSVFFVGVSIHGAAWRAAAGLAIFMRAIAKHAIRADMQANQRYLL